MGFSILSCGSGENNPSSFTAKPLASQEPISSKQDEIWAPRWDYLGGFPDKHIAVASWEAGRLDVFWRQGSNLKHKWYPYNGGWSFEENLATNLSADPGAVSDGTGRLWVFWRGTDGYLWHRSFQGSWGASAQTSPLYALPAGAVPAVSSWSQGRFDVFWRGSDSHVKHIWKDLYMQSWGPTIPEDLGGTLFPNTNPSAVSWGPARIDLVWQEGISLVHKNYPCSGGTCCGAWTCGTNLGGSLTSSPTVASWDVNRLDVFYKTGSSTLGHKWSTNGGSSWTVEEDLGWVPNAPTAIAWGSLRLDVFSSTSLSGGQVMRRTWEPNQPWYPLVPPVGTVVVPPTNQTTEGIGPLKIWEYGATFVPNTSSNSLPA